MNRLLRSFLLRSGSMALGTVLAGCSGGSHGGGTSSPVATSDYISGYVQAPDGTAVSGATVTLTEPDSTSLTAMTGSAGYYYFGGLLHTNYTLTVTFNGYRIQPSSVAVSPSTASVNFTASAGARTLYGVNFSPYEAGQSPDIGSVISSNQVQTRLAAIAPQIAWVRSFASDHGLENIPGIAHALGLRTAVGAWLSTDSTANEAQISALIAAGRAGLVDIAVVGSEVLLRGDLSESQLLGYLNAVKAALPGIPVAMDDTYGEWLSHPGLLDAVDIVFANYYPYWEGIALTNAMATLHGRHMQMTNFARGKPVIVGETGWPSGGNTVANAVPSPANASYFALDFVSWATANNVAYFYFEAFDESWKAAAEGPQGAHWGVWDENGHLKAGMDSLFTGSLLQDNWSGQQGGDSPGTPSVILTHVPAYGSSELLQGQALHVSWLEYGVVVYLNVDGGWWVKPTFASPISSLQSDGTWSCNVVTGGVDAYATSYAIFVIPNSFSPPLLGGDGSLPQDLYNAAIAHLIVQRN